MTIVSQLVILHQRVFSWLENHADRWLLGLLARIVFLAVLAFYFWNSAKTKIGEGFFGFLNIQDGAYFQILGEQGMLAYEFDTANIPFHVDAIVYLGTWMEFILPALIILGLFTRIAAIGMMIFVIVQSYVDIAVHKVDPTTIGALFDRQSGSVILDQRALWSFLLIYLILKGAGALSLDRVLAGWWGNNKERPDKGALPDIKPA